jgi:hypothetical protein
MAVFKCALGDFAVVRYCVVTPVTSITAAGLKKREDLKNSNAPISSGDSTVAGLSSSSSTKKTKSSKNMQVPLHRTYFQYEIEKLRHREKIKYDVVSTEAFIATSDGFDRRPPYVTYNWKFMHHDEKSLMAMRFVDAAFF